MSGTAIALGARLHGLFSEAWARRRRRQRWAGAVAAVLALGAVGVLVINGRPSPPVVRVPRTATLQLPRAPYVGVACPGAPNSIACDRVGIAVFVRQAPARLVASIGGRSVTLRDAHIRCSPTTSPCDKYFVGYLTHAGLIDGALRVTPDRGRYRWFGRHPVSASVRIRATDRRGRVAETTRRVALGPGWG